MSIMGLFFIQLEESTDCSNQIQMVIFVRWLEVKGNKGKYFGLCRSGYNDKRCVHFKKIKNVLADFELNRQYCVLISTDGSPCLLGVNNGLARFVKDGNPNIIMNHCLIHRLALSSKTLGYFFEKKMNIFVEILTQLRRARKQVAYLTSFVNNRETSSKVCYIISTCVGYQGAISLSAYYSKGKSPIIPNK